jgi:hypothetical protein
MYNIYIWICIINYTLQHNIPTIDQLGWSTKCPSFLWSQIALWEVEIHHPEYRNMMPVASSPKIENALRKGAHVLNMFGSPCLK